MSGKERERRTVSICRNRASGLALAALLTMPRLPFQHMTCSVYTGIHESNA